MSSKKLAKKNAAARVSPSGRDATSRVEETLNKVEDLVVNSSHLPLTGKSMIDENDLIHLVEELRQDLPLELNHAREIMEKETEIIEQAHREADEIIQKAKDYAAGLVAKETVVTEAQAKAREIEAQSEEKARVLVEQAQQQRAEVLARTREESKQLRDAADTYVNQVFDQLIGHVADTAKFAQQSVNYLQQSVSSIDQARGTLQQAKEQMNRGAAEADHLRRLALDQAIERVGMRDKFVDWRRIGNAQSGCNVAELQVIIEKQRPITRSMGNKRRNRRDGAFPSTTASAHHRHQKALPLRVGQFAIDARKQRLAAGRQDRKAPLVGFDMWLPHSYVCCV